MKFLISAGPTVEPIDQVRFISNHSSGRMGVALALEASRRGHEVTVVHGPLQTKTFVDERVAWVKIETARDMLKSLTEALGKSDVLIMAAAVCDVRPVAPSAGKKHKDELLIQHFEKNPDLLQELSRLKTHQHLVAFSLGEELSHGVALEKLKNKGADWVVYNGLSSMGSDSGDYGVLDSQGKDVIELQHTSKEDFALVLIQALEKLKS